MTRPPPTEPGTPPRNSTPPRCASVATCRSLPVDTPASTRRVIGPAGSILRSARVATTRPRTPPSRTSRFDPAPTAVTGIPRAAHQATARRQSSTVAGSSHASAGPPKRLRGLPTSAPALPLGQEGQELAAGELDVSGAQRDDDVSRPAARR